MIVLTSASGRNDSHERHRRATPAARTSGRCRTGSPSVALAPLPGHEKMVQAIATVFNVAPIMNCAMLTGPIESRGCASGVCRLRKGDAGF